MEDERSERERDCEYLSYAAMGKAVDRYFAPFFFPSPLNLRSEAFSNK